MTAADPARRRALGDFLRARRARLTPAMAGLPAGGRRFNHPEDGPLRFEQLTLVPVGRPELKLVLLMPLDPPRRRPRVPQVTWPGGVRRRKS